ncbi:exo-alpha-sialidase [Jiangella sp. DSM 45060]|uniref:exo-alpha-sialidase n=1 Tax=Jiangella sp. DSM 45060 TaxID=1798224 RepID=UPI00087A52EC|nr:exo-alpha-sialidase [Jiangella sp. DSM 45060]SDT21629.1 BNR repeat-like domain-containing protein [Jiangella sp. DSM 45060]
MPQRTRPLPRRRLAAVLAAAAMALACLAPAAGAEPETSTAETADPVPAADPAIPSAAGLLASDPTPATGAVPGFGASGSVALDYRRRSVGADLFGPATVRRIELVDSDATTRLLASDYTLWTSDDNVTYEPLTGWTMTAGTEGGRLVHTFAGFEVTTRYVKINTRYDDTAFTFVLSNLTADVRLYGDPPASGQDNHTGLTVVDSGTVYADAVTPSYRPAITRAPNGDLLVAFNTSSDLRPGGEIQLVRSTDGGATWGEPVTVASPRYFENGAIHASRGMTTLSDGTVLLPFNDGVNYAPFNHRDSVLFVARSDDSGLTWDGVDEPVQLPVETQEHWAGSRILELDDGSLIMGLWGTLDLVDDWETDPMRWRAATVRSYDGGRTWTDYATIGYDPNTPPDFPRPGTLQPYGINEQSLVELGNGRLMAIMRFNGSLRQPEPFRTYVSYSGDGGRTWSDPVSVPLEVETPSLTAAPCTTHLGDGRSKLLYGYRDRADYPSGIAAASVSFDNGTTWEGQLVFEDPSGRPPGVFTSAEPDFLQLDGDRMLVVFQSRVAPAPFGLAFNIVQDESPDECREHAERAQAATEAAPALQVERADRAGWPFGYGVTQRAYDAGTPIGEVATDAAQSVWCSADEPVLYAGDRPLDPEATLAEAGVRNGDVVRVRSARPDHRWWRVGFADLDVFPETRHLYAWDDACPHRPLTLDHQSRSLGLSISIPAGQQVGAVELADDDAGSRLTASDYRLFAGPDNETFRELTGWTLSTRVDDGRLVHRFDGLAMTDRYLKIHQVRDDDAGTFVLADPSGDDVSIELSPRDCDTTITGTRNGPLTVDDGLTCLVDATQVGAVTVSAGAQLAVRDSSIIGPVLSTRAAGLTLCDTRVVGTVAVTGTTTLALVGDAGMGCEPNTVIGAVSFTGNTGGVRVGGNEVTGRLWCDGNDPAPVNGGVPNVVSGSRAGQCAGL